MKHLKLYEMINNEIVWKPISDENSVPEIGKLYLITIQIRYGSDERVVSLGQYNYNGKGKLTWDHDDRMIAYAELPPPYDK